MKLHHRAPARPFRVVAWGTYDLGKPRTRILLRGLRELGVDVVECHKDVWTGIEDKSQLPTSRAFAGRILRWCLSYPLLVLRYFFAGAHDAVLVGYLGQLDVLVLWPWARLRRKPVVWDAFLSLYSTVVQDRRLISERHPLARFLFAWEWLACRAADRVVLDTRAHAHLFRELYGLPDHRLGVSLLGAEPDRFFQTEQPESSNVDRVRRVLFYGQLIPLHGVSTILAAAELSRDNDVEWLIVGDGQERPLLERKVGAPGLRMERIRWLRWIPYEDLREAISESEVCLGIFGTSDKAARVIPNKVFQILATGSPLVTRDSPAVRELVGDQPEFYGVTLVNPGDPEALSRAVDMVVGGNPYPTGWKENRRTLVRRVSPSAVSQDLLRILQQEAAR